MAGWILNTGIRKEFYKGINPRLQYSLGLRYKAGERLILRSGLSNKFRKPTFNEKYWKPGGNPGLRPEKGWGGELAAEYVISGRDDKFRLEGMVMGYFQHVDNWIQWVTRDSLTPVEYKKVHARGIEARIDCRINVGSVALKGFLNYGYNRSELMETYDQNPLSEGKQMVYVPLHTARTSISATYSGFELGISNMLVTQRKPSKLQINTPFTGVCTHGPDRRLSQE
jgi:iron complex outermembrane receptor protein